MAPSFLYGGLMGLILSQITVPVHGKSTDSAPLCPVFYSQTPSNCRPVPETFLDFKLEHIEPKRLEIEVLEDAFDGLVALQRDYFDIELGTWTTAIDWTAAVIETVLAGTLTTLTNSLGSIHLKKVDDWLAKENLISSYYAQVVGFNFGQDILSLRGQAYDDMLWVVLGWIEAVKFVNAHSKHYPTQGDNSTASSGLKEALATTPWHGSYWIDAFAHRSRIFWELSSAGWDTSLCHGGMIWNPRLLPYKNAITNELWISASISMYQFYPGDNFSSPFIASTMFPDRDPVHLAAAVEGYRWLKDVNMTNSQGLYVDGFHVDSSIPGNVECDQRDEMVYTYNQGVVLTGQRGLYTVTGSPSYLEEGHKLIQSVITASGWNLLTNSPSDNLDLYPPGTLPPWHGIGRGGILEEQCDASGTCSQDSQTFKGIFFHHLSAFCAQLDPVFVTPDLKVDMKAYEQLKDVHSNACRSYLGWVRHNADAALQTRDSQGHFGMWWGANLFHNTMATRNQDGINHSAVNVTDYRNHGTPEDKVWGMHSKWTPGSGPAVPNSNTEVQVQKPSAGRQRRLGRSGVHWVRADSDPVDDPNSRGRGRTVETQIGGLSLLRAYWELSQLGQ